MPSRALTSLYDFFSERSRKTRGHGLLQVFWRRIGLACVAAALLPQGAWADQSGFDYRDFSSMIRRAQSPCSGVEGCVLAPQSGLYTQPVYDRGSKQQLELAKNVAPSVLMALHAIAREQAKIWADTILEGDYLADGETRLDQVEGVFRNDHLVGYRITYSERAWYVGENGQKPGRIVEASFVSPGLSSWLRDEMAFADFFSSTVAEASLD